MRRFPPGRTFLLGNILGIALGITATIYTRPRIPALLWWLFSRGDG